MPANHWTAGRMRHTSDYARQGDGSTVVFVQRVLLLGRRDGV